MSDNNTRVPPVNKEDEILEYTQKQRKDLVIAITAKGMPSDIKERMTLLSALDGMDRAALGIKKIKVEDKAATANANSVATLAIILSKIGPKSLDNPGIRLSIPELSTNIPEPQLISGEMVIGTQAGNYEDFMKTMQGTVIDTEDNIDS